MAALLLQTIVCYTLLFIQVTHCVYILECMTYKALLIFYAQVIRGDRLERLDAFYLCQLLQPLRVEPILVNIIR